MYNLLYKDGLLHAQVIIANGSNSIDIQDVIIDTGACKSILLTDYLYEIGVKISGDEELVVMSGIGGVEVSAFKKRIDSIMIGDVCLKDIVIDFGVIDPQERVNGLIGMDILSKIKAVIDIDNKTLHTKL